MREPESKLRQRSVGRTDRSRDPAILNAALAALIENGYDATNMNDIAAPVLARPLSTGDGLRKRH
jgi:AcrR family transcriptional regulator